jgi:hypothetical protein
MMTGELRDRTISWAALTVTQGEVLDAFASYCGELDDLTVVARTPVRLELDWRGREWSAVALAAVIPDALPATPELLIAELSDVAVVRFLDDEALRARVAVVDLGRLEKVNASRTSAFVYFEWFLRDQYGVKLVPCEAFTRGLVERGIISLGMG